MFVNWLEEIPDCSQAMFVLFAKAKYYLNRKLETLLQLKYDPLDMPEKPQLKTEEILNNFPQIKLGEGRFMQFYCCISYVPRSCYVDACFLYMLFVLI